MTWFITWSSHQNSAFKAVRKPISPSFNSWVLKILAKVTRVTRVTRVTDYHLQGAHPSKWSFARCQILRMIICKRQDHLGDHLQMTGPSRWSFARGQILRMISYKRPVFLDDHLQGAGFSWWSFARDQSIRMIFCKRPVPLDDHLHGAVLFADLGRSAQMLQNSEKSGPVLLRVGVEVALFPGHR